MGVLLPPALSQRSDDSDGVFVDFANDVQSLIGCVQRAHNDDIENTSEKVDLQPTLFVVVDQDGGRGIGTKSGISIGSIAVSGTYEFAPVTTASASTPLQQALRQLAILAQSDDLLIGSRIGSSNSDAVGVTDVAPVVWTPNEEARHRPALLCARSATAKPRFVYCSVIQQGSYVLFSFSFV